jgi:AcrR family transcriptional regulator
MNSHSRNAARRVRSRLDDKRRRMLDSAIEQFARRGYHGVTMPEVAIAAGVAAGTLYRYFDDKQDLVNEAFRDAKGRLRDAVFDGLSVDPGREPRTVFLDLWTRVVRFAREDPQAFQFLEMQDHVAYLDPESRQVEVSVLVPLWLAGQQLRGTARDLPVEVLIALVWGGLVGLFKAERHGYIRLDDAVLARAGEACWAAFRPDDAR